MKFEYKNRTGGFALLPEADYEVEIIDVETGLSKGAKTRGSDVWTLKLRELSTGAEHLDEGLIFHPACEWKIDVVLRAIGRAPTAAGEIELTPDTFKGGRARVSVIVEKYDKNDGSEGKSNEIAAWHASTAPKTAPKVDDDFA